MNDQTLAPLLPIETAPDLGALVALGEQLDGAFGALTLEERLTTVRAAVPGRLVFTTSFGLEDQAISHAIFARDLAIDVVTFDTGRLFPQTHQVWAQTEQRYGRRIQALLPERRSVEAWIAEHGIEALVIDTAHFFIELIPMSLGIPYVHVWNVLNMDLSGTTPPCLFSWPPDSTPEALARNVEELEWIGKFLGPLAEQFAIPYAAKTGLEIDWSNPTATVSKLAIISQIPKEFDFPTIPWPPQFHYTGPFHDDRGREPIPFPWAKLDGRPLIYASMGTLVNGLEDVYKTILKTFSPMSDFQVVLSVGHNVSIDRLRPIPSNVIVVPSAPQLELLKRATLCITHAGLNTTLESLAKGVPMVAIPIGYDQPGTAARIAYHGAGEFIELEELTVDRLSALVRQVQTTPSYREKARYFQEIIAKTRGLDRAAEVIEEAFVKSQTPDPAEELSQV